MTGGKKSEGEAKPPKPDHDGPVKGSTVFQKYRNSTIRRQRDLNKSTGGRQQRRKIGD